MVLFVCFAFVSSVINLIYLKQLLQLYCTMGISCGSLGRSLLGYVLLRSNIRGKCHIGRATSCPHSIRSIRSLYKCYLGRALISYY